MKMGSAGVSGRGRPIAIGDQSELYYFGPVLSAARVEGQRCGCKAGRVRLIFNFSFPLLATHNLGLEGLGGPLVGLGFFSVSPPPSKVVGPSSTRVAGPRRIDLSGGTAGCNWHGRARPGSS